MDKEISYPRMRLSSFAKFVVNWGPQSEMTLSKSPKQA